MKYYLVNIMGRGWNRIKQKKSIRDERPFTNEQKNGGKSQPFDLHQIFQLFEFGGSGQPDRDFAFD